jgi:subtilase family protein
MPQVSVKLVDGVAVERRGSEIDSEQLVALLSSYAPAPEAQLVEVLGRATIHPAFGPITDEDVQGLVREAQTNRPDYSPPDFRLFLAIECPPGVDAEWLASALSQLEGIVGYAHVVRERSDPGVVGTNNPFFTDQGYLEQAPTGIDAQAAWAEGADGAGIRFVDLERGWLLEHHDLPQTIQLLNGVIVPTSRFHGCAVLGIVLAIDNTSGVVGIAPAADADVWSYATPTLATIGTNQFDFNSAAAIMGAAQNLSFGDILLIEVEAGGLPVEVDLADCAAISLATSKGIIVIEAAGNNAENLDNYADLIGTHPLNRSLGPPEFFDSGAIMVGACTSGLTPGLLRTRWQEADDLGSNYGSRIDCHAWGHMITTTGDPNNVQDLDGYTSSSTFYNPPGTFGFGGTSGASAIVAGVCVLVQQLCSILTPAGAPFGKFGPYEMRTLLQQHENCTDLDMNVPAQSSSEIACMPNLAAIIANEFS